ncbi:hypothetical protein [Natrinema ejinorense]|uniref:Uncharacterized protein n=1 Tax=Natrinema ejinorense TaxID=373386 RepID=A0A2A5QYI3_9EURY|nr:hypothetical protein [Natrinema ejinorense]PCR91833.1 hypothetical protein CP557_15660 [Natrinema ejinorense]
MNAKIEGESEGFLKIYVEDNKGAKHDLTVHNTSGIEYHSCDEIANNPALRTREECERVDQTRRYARWYVYRERGYDTVPPRENSDRLMAALLAVAELSPTAFESHFGNLETRLQAHYDDSEVDLPFPDADPDDAIVYQKDLYLQPDPVQFDPPVLEQFMARFEGDPESPAIDALDELQFGEMDVLDFEIEAISGIRVLHNDGQGNQQVAESEQPLEREPDARIELMAFDPASVDSFQHYVVSHLAYQIRDRFLLMGVKPPVPFRAQGWGTYEGFQCQKFCSLYDEYWSSEATIQSWEPW